MLLVLCLPALLAVASCGGQKQDHPGDPAGLPALQQLGNVLPDPASLRETSVTLDTEVPGKDAALASANTIEVGDSLTLLSDPATSSWAIYSFNPGLAYLDQVQLLMDMNPGNEYFAAVADYGSGRWLFQGPFTGSTTLVLSDATQRSPAGNFHVAVITGSGNEANVQKLVLQAETYWHTVTVESAGDVGRYSSLVETSTGPAIACYDFSSADLVYCWSSSPDGANASDWETVRVASSGSVGYYCSMEIVQGNPAICYLEYISEDVNNLMYARSSTSTGASLSDWEFTEVDLIHPSVGGFPSLAVINGRPAVSYYNIKDTDLMYARANNDTGTGLFWTPVKVHQSPADDFVGFGTSLAEVDGRPQIAYLEFNPYKLWYARSSTPEGDHVSEWDYYELSAAEPVTNGVSIAEVSGRPLISFYDAAGGALRVYSTLNADPATEFNWASSIVDDGSGVSSDVGWYSSLAVIGGYPCIAYQDVENKSLRFAESMSPVVGFSTGWQNIEVEDGSGGLPNVGRHTSIAEINGHPAISYYDSTNKDLKYAILLPPGS